MSSSLSTFESCSFQHADDQFMILQCVADQLDQQGAGSPAQTVSADGFLKWMLILAGALVFFMQAGFAMLCAGAVRRKNVNNTMLKNLLDACGAAIAYYTIGYGLAFGAKDAEASTFAGNDNFFLSGNVDSATFFFQYAFSAAAATIVAGTLAERCKMIAYLCYSLVLTGIVYPVVVHAIWSSNGYFSTGNSDTLIGIGVVDFAGSGVVHLTGGCTALYATWILGPRHGRFYTSDGTPKSKPGLTKGHSTALQMLGTFILWFGWMGFNPGSALLLGAEDMASVAAHAAVTTTLAAASGAISALFTKAIILERRQGEFVLDIVVAMNGCLSGLVAITAGCGVVTEGLAIVIGVISGWVYLGGTSLLIRFKIDDAVDAIPVHMFNGIWGLIATGLFAEPGLLLAAYGVDSHPGFFYAPTESNLLPAHLAGLAFILVWTLVTMLPFFIALDFFNLFRVHELEELAGLDANYLSEHKSEADSEEDEDRRLEAYNARLKQKRDERAKFMGELSEQQWGSLSFDNDFAASKQARDMSTSSGTTNSRSRQKLDIRSVDA